jgi:hypothetical protein
VLVIVSACGLRLHENGAPAIPGIGWLAMALDTEGNAFGIIEADPSAQESFQCGPEWPTSCC